MVERSRMLRILVAINGYLPAAKRND